jgi:hypothetical protein
MSMMGCACELCKDDGYYWDEVLGEYVKCGCMT